jgi:hypothetical protein
MKKSKTLRKINIRRNEKLIVLVIASFTIKDLEPEFFYIDADEVENVIKNAEKEKTIIKIIRVSPESTVYSSLDGAADPEETKPLHLTFPELEEKI